MPFGIGLEKSATYFKEYLQVCRYQVGGFFEPDTVGHVVEMAIGVTHIEMKHPTCCTAAQKSFSKEVVASDRNI